MIYIILRRIKNVQGIVSINICADKDMNGKVGVICEPGAWLEVDCFVSFEATSTSSNFRICRFFIFRGRLFKIDSGNINFEFDIF